MRVVFIALAAVLLSASTSLACINDRAVKVDEHKFRSGYAAQPEQPVVTAQADSGNLPGVGAGLLAGFGTVLAAASVLGAVRFATRA